MSNSSGKGGGVPQQPANVAARDYGSQANAANAGLHNQLSDVFGYTGEFGGGQWADWAQANLSPAQRQQARIMEYNWKNPQQSSLATEVMSGLGDAARQTRKWSKYTPQQLAETDLNPYMDPYQQAVIDTSMKEMARSHDMQGDILNAQAVGASAFGGDRHGIAQAEMNRNFADQQERWLSKLLSDNFRQAQQGAMFDIGGQFQNKQLGLQGASQLGSLANLGFGMGQGMYDMQRQAGADQYNINQRYMDQAMQQWAALTGQPYKGLQAWAGGAPQYAAGQTQSSDPGLMNWLGLGLKFASLCWVAREVYGPENPRWLDFRSWMVNDAPDWLYNLYKDHGEQFAKVVRRFPILKRVLRPLMDKVIG